MNNINSRQTAIHNSKKIYPILIFVVSIFIFVIGTNQFDFGNEESRFILFAQEMLRHGVTPFPLLQGKFYPDYPATTTWFIYCFSWLTHKVTPLTSVLPSAIASAITLVFVYKIAALHSSRWGLFSILILLMSYVFLLLARLPSPDPFVAAVVTIGFYEVYQRKWLANKYALGWTPVLLLLGFCLRGPMGLVVPALVIGFFYLIEKNGRWFLLTGFYSVLLLIIATASELQVAKMIGGKLFAEEVYRMQIGGRLGDLGQRPFYYYFINGFLGYALAFPLAAITVLSQRKKIFSSVTDPQHQLLKHLVSWVLVILILFSFPHEKHFRYILSAVPALGLLAGYLWIAKPETLWITLTKKVVKIICWGLPFLGLSAIAFCFYWSNIHQLYLPFYVWPAIAGFIVSLIILVAANYKTSIENELWTLAAGALAYLIFFIAIAQPIANQQITSVRPLFERIQAWRGNDEPLVFYTNDEDRDNLKFLVLLDQKELPMYLHTPEQLMSYKQKAVFLADQRLYVTIPPATLEHYQVLIKTRQARRNWVVFTQKNTTTGLQQPQI